MKNIYIKIDILISYLIYLLMGLISLPGSVFDWSSILQTITIWYAIFTFLMAPIGN